MFAVAGRLLWQRKVGCRVQGAGNREQGAGSREQGRQEGKVKEARTFGRIQSVQYAVITVQLLG